MAAIGLLILASFVFNDSLRMTFSRRRMIGNAQTELNDLSSQLTALRQKITTLKAHPQSYEQLVRRELGYTRPGEKEIRFVKEEK
jgi:cell division protein FtsB